MFNKMPFNQCFILSVHSEVNLPVGVKQHSSINHATDATGWPFKPWRSSAYSLISGIVQFNIQLLDNFRYRAVQHTTARQFQVSCSSAYNC